MRTNKDKTVWTASSRRSTVAGKPIDNYRWEQSNPRHNSWHHNSPVTPATSSSTDRRPKSCSRTAPSSGRIPTVARFKSSQLLKTHFLLSTSRCRCRDLNSSNCRRHRCSRSTISYKSTSAVNQSTSQCPTTSTYSNRT